MAAGTVTLSADVAVQVGQFALAVDLTVDSGDVVGIVGPNGAGKSTLLRVLAGLLALDAGRVALDGVVLDDPASGVFVPPEARPAGVVFQDYLLFPHLSALDNVAFGCRRRGVPRREARRRAREWLDRMGLADRAAARPAELSGGQAQRIALARALATDPALLLLDEPLAALDAPTRRDVRRDLHHHLDAFHGVRLLVTHDPLDALTLADRIVVIEDGRVVQTGRPDEIAAQPRSAYVAELVGTNLFRGTAAGGVVRTASGADLAVVDTAAVGAVFVVIPPAAVALYRTRPDGSPRNTWPATVAGVDRLGDRTRVRVTGPLTLVADVTPAAAAELPAEVWVAVKATEIQVYPA
ncbi:MAG: transporter ATP-binding protein [Acidimicrobiales bacterium]|jgi:molybdate transport system ATP-binding protein|nr:transporter ATP-binding protein [Acidimicrobiales bacterium]